MASEADIANRIPITGALMAATLMNTLDSTILNVALPQMRATLGASQDQVTWILTSYIIATAIMTPLSGWLSLKIGRKPIFLVSITVFTVASMACGLAQNLPEMVIFRFIQGVAGASLMPLSQATMLDIYPMRLVPQVMSIWSAVVIIGPIIGPLVGGQLIEVLSWRWAFFINLPIGIMAFLGIYVFMSRDPGNRQRPFDFLGFGSLVLFVVAFQLMTDRGPNNDWFDSAETWVEAILAGLAFWIFIIQTITTPHPFFHPDLAKDRNYVSCQLFGLAVGALLFSTTALLPTLMQNLLGYTALQSGYASMPRGVGSLVAFLAVPYLINHIGPRKVLLIGIGIACYALWLMGRFDLSMTSGPIMLSGLVQGFGVGLLFAPLNTLSYATLNPVHRTEGTIVATMGRSLGSSLGISMMSASLTSLTVGAHARMAGRMVVGDPVLGSLPPFMNPGGPPGGDGGAAGLAALDGVVTQQAAMMAYDTIFSWMAVGVLFLAPLLLLMRPPPPAMMAPAETPAE